MEGQHGIRWAQTLKERWEAKATAGPSEMPDHVGISPITQPHACHQILRFSEHERQTETDEQLTYHSSTRAPVATQDHRWRIGIDDAIILPMVLSAFLATTLYQAAVFVMPVLSALVSTLFSRVIACPWLVAVAAGDGIAWMLKWLSNLPLRPRARGEEWRNLVDRRWSRLRQRMSYEAIAMRARNVLRRGTDRAFQRCGALSPRAALFVIASVMLWLPLSAAISIGIHTILLTNAASLPAWIQLLHPVATVIAKSKLLVLPAYLAAWPQAKKHAWVQAAFRWAHRIAELDCMRKAAHRYRQTKQAVAQVGESIGIKCV
jgi:hypothetical protein